MLSSSIIPVIYRVISKEILQNDILKKSMSQLIGEEIHDKYLKIGT